MPRMSYSRRIVGSKRWPIRSLEVGSQNPAEPRPEIGVLEPERYRCFEKAELVAAVETLALEAQPVKGLAIVDQPGERIGQLNLAAAPRLRTRQVAKDLGLNDVTAD